MIALLFGYANAMTLVLSTFNLPTQIVSMLPYVAVLAVLLMVGIRNYKGAKNITGDTI
jgi:ABC-type uncharacterized transport system permease subunit